MADHCCSKCGWHGLFYYYYKDGAPCEPRNFVVGLFSCVIGHVIMTTLSFVLWSLDNGKWHKEFCIKIKWSKIAFNLFLKLESYFSAFGLPLPVKIPCLVLKCFLLVFRVGILFFILVSLFVQASSLGFVLVNSSVLLMQKELPCHHNIVTLAIDSHVAACA